MASRVSVESFAKEEHFGLISKVGMHFGSSCYWQSEKLDAGSGCKLVPLTHKFVIEKEGKLSHNWLVLIDSNLNFVYCKSFLYTSWNLIMNLISIHSNDANLQLSSKTPWEDYLQKLDLLEAAALRRGHVLARRIVTFCCPDYANGGIMRFAKYPPRLKFRFRLLWWRVKSLLLFLQAISHWT